MLCSCALRAVVFGSLSLEMVLYLKLPRVNMCLYMGFDFIFFFVFEIEVY